MFVGKRPVWVVITAVKTRRLRMMKVRARERGKCANGLRGRMRDHRRAARVYMTDE